MMNNDIVFLLQELNIITMVVQLSSWMRVRRQDYDDSYDVRGLGFED